MGGTEKDSVGANLVFALHRQRRATQGSPLQSRQPRPPYSRMSLAGFERRIFSWSAALRPAPSTKSTTRSCIMS